MPVLVVQDGGCFLEHARHDWVFELAVSCCCCCCWSLPWSPLHVISSLPTLCMWMWGSIYTPYGHTPPTPRPHFWSHLNSRHHLLILTGGGFHFHLPSIQPLQADYCILHLTKILRKKCYLSESFVQVPTKQRNICNVSLLQQNQKVELDYQAWKLKALHTNIKE